MISIGVNVRFVPITDVCLFLARLRALAFELIFLANKIGKLSTLAVSCPRATEERRRHGEAEAAEIAGFTTIRSGHDSATGRTGRSCICRRTRSRAASLRKDRHVAGGRKEGDGVGAPSWRQSGTAARDGRSAVAGQPSPPAAADLMGRDHAGSHD